LGYDLDKRDSRSYYIIDGRETADKF